MNNKESHIRAKVLTEIQNTTAHILFNVLYFGIVKKQVSLDATRIIEDDLQQPLRARDIQSVVWDACLEQIYNYEK